MKIKILVLLAFFFLSGCKKETKVSISRVDELVDLDCFIPDDAVVKFKTLNENTFGSLVLDFLKENGIEKNEVNTLKIKEWCKNEIFGLLNNKIEWQLYDREFCEIQSSDLLDGVSEKHLFESNILICNSLLNEDSTVGGYWQLYTQDYQIEIMVCNEITEQLGFVPYYEILKNTKGNYELSLQKEMMKYYTNSNVYIEYKTTNGLFLIRDILISDKGILYSGSIDDLKKVVKPKKEIVI